MERFAKACGALEVMQALWSGTPTDYQGTYFQLDGALVAPPPVQPGGVPVWFGGFSDSLFAALLRYGHGWILGTNPAPEFIVERRARLYELAAAAGRDPGEIRIAVPLMVHLSTDRDRAQASIEDYIHRGDFAAWLGDFFGENARRYGLWGTADDALARLQPYLDIGIRDFIFDLRPPAIAIESAELLASDVLPRLGAWRVTLVAIGEAMLELCYEPAELAGITGGFGGDVLNSAVMAARLGAPAALLGRVGHDAAGRRLLDHCRSESVDADWVVVDGEAATGIYSSELGTDGARRFDYHRTGSAGSRLVPADVDEALIARASSRHGHHARRVRDERGRRQRAVELGRRHGGLVSITVNHRPRLGGDLERLRSMVGCADLVFASSDEANTVFGTDDALELRRRLGTGVREVVVTHGPAGAVVGTERALISQPALPLGRLESEGRLDTAGAGDAVAGAYLARRLAGAAPADAIGTAVVAGSLSCLRRGASRSYPSSAEIDRRRPQLPPMTVQEIV